MQITNFLSFDLKSSEGFIYHSWFPPYCWGSCLLSLFQSLIGDGPQTAGTVYKSDRNRISQCAALISGTCGGFMKGSKAHHWSSFPQHLSGPGSDWRDGISGSLSSNKDELFPDCCLTFNHVCRKTYITTLLYRTG